MWSLIFVLTTLGLFLLPLLPAISEWMEPTDYAPLKVVQDYDGDIRHFANGFRRYVYANFAELLKGRGREGLLNRDTPFQIVSESGLPAIGEGDKSEGTTRTLILSPHALTLPGGMFFESEIYSASDITGGARDLFRALLAERDIHLADESTVLRWVHADGELTVGNNCKLFGRVSANKHIRLGEECAFERMHSARIDFGQPPGAGLPAIGKEPYMIAQGMTHLEELPHVRDHSGRRWLVHGRAEIPTRHFFDGDIVASADVKLGSGAHIRGSIKSNGDMFLGTGVIIEGSVFSAGDLYVGPGCRIKGPVVAERVLYIETGTIIGSESLPTCVNAPQIQIETGSTVFGTVWASEEASVIAPQKGSYGIAA